ncbi:MAG: protein translocase subunit SecD [bacterium]
MRKKLRWQATLIVVSLGIFLYFLIPTIRWLSISPSEREKISSWNAISKAVRERLPHLTTLSKEKIKELEQIWVTLPEAERKNSQIWNSLSEEEKKEIALWCELPLEEREMLRRWTDVSSEERAKLEKKGELLNKILKLGLDLQGGMHLVLEVDTAKLPPGSDPSDAVDRALEIIRNRIDKFGVSEPVIQRHGKDKIVVQLPGLKDPHRAKNLIGSTALLEFRLVDNERLEAAEEGKVPKGYEILEDEEGKKFLLKKDPELTGDSLVNAWVDTSQAGGIMAETVVSLEFNKEGARKFARVTGAHVGEQLAIVLDRKVRSAPVIRSRIDGGRAQIEGNFSLEEARDLKIILRAGSLPAPVKIIEERTVGPSLGQDSIRKGIIASIAGFVLVVLFMIIYYRISGVIANVALVGCLIMLLGGLAGFKGTLTLPGIAGIILTMGMAVDSNIIIFERIREELRANRTIKAAIDVGYKKAFWTVFDSHITTLITGLILFTFGTGPIKGFAITLSLGVSISLFTAVVITRLIFDLRKEYQTLSI